MKRRVLDLKTARVPVGPSLQSLPLRADQVIE